MNNHERLLISNNRGQVGVNALERFQFCMVFLSFTFLSRDECEREFRLSKDIRLVG